MLQLRVQNFKGAKIIKIIDYFNLTFIANDTSFFSLLPAGVIDSGWRVKFDDFFCCRILLTLVNVHYFLL